MAQPEKSLIQKKPDEGAILRDAAHDLGLVVGAWSGGAGLGSRQHLELHLEHARLRLLRGFDELLCLEGLSGVEHLPHQIETVRKVLRHFKGRVLLADEVGLGKTIEACLLLREYLLRGLVKRVLILTPPALVSQWQEELASKFGLDFEIPPKKTRGEPGYWHEAQRVLWSLASAKSERHMPLVTATPWDLVIVDEAHHCRNRTTKNWRLVNALQRRHLFLLTATPVQNDLLELYNLLTLLKPGHLKTAGEFRRRFVKRGSPRDPRNRQILRELVNDVMVRNTRSLVQVDLPPRYAQTLVLKPSDEEEQLNRDFDAWLRTRTARGAGGDARGAEARALPSAGALSRMAVSSLLSAAGSHPLTLAASLRRAAGSDARGMELAARAEGVRRSAKESRLLELLQDNRDAKTLVFAGFRQTLERLSKVLDEAGIGHALFSGAQSIPEKDAAVARFQDEVPVLLCSESGGEGRNLQFANTLINFDLPWNPMRIEQRIGRLHRIGQTREVFVFNLCVAGSVEARVLRVLDEKINMFELVVGEIGSILGNLKEGQEFETLVLDLWLRTSKQEELDASFDDLGESLLEAQAEYIKARELDEALFGEDYA